MRKEEMIWVRARHLREAMAWYDGDWWLDDQVWRQNYLDNAGQFLTELDLRNG